jgi:hypothetical protein
VPSLVRIHFKAINNNLPHSSFLNYNRGEMAKIRIKNEYLPERCEICHKSDCFDKQTGICSRCSQAMKQNDSRSNGEYLLIKPQSPSIYSELQSKSDYQYDRYLKLFSVTAKVLSYLFARVNTGAASSLNVNDLLLMEYRHGVRQHKVFFGIPILLSLFIGIFNRVFLFGTIFFLIIGTIEFVAIRYKWRKINRIIKGEFPEDIFMILRKEEKSDDFTQYIAELYINSKRNEPDYRLNVTRPSWAIDSIVNKRIPAKVYFYHQKKKKAVIHTQFGVLVNL